MFGIRAAGFFAAGWVIYPTALREFIRTIDAAASRWRKWTGEVDFCLKSRPLPRRANEKYNFRLYGFNF